MNDLEFVQGCVNGNKQSWNEFIERYSRLIYKYIHSVIQSKGFNSSQDLVDDIFQELFTSLIRDDYKKLRSFKAKNGCSLASWLRQVTVNLSLDYLRKIKPVISLDVEVSENLFLKDTFIADTIPASDLLNLKEELISLEECIQRLSSQDKYLIEFNVNQGVKLEVLRKFLKLSRGAIDMQKSRVIDRLKECFKSKGFKLDL
jgi:RNA polymerase sigma-70 factor (ECF subfamily)